MTGTPTNACKMMSKADLWLMRNYWDFDFPRPFLPNFIFLGGVHCQPAKPLPKVRAVFNITRSIQYFQIVTVHNDDSSAKKHILFQGVFLFVCSQQDMEEFVQSSGDDGIVVFSLGSMINNITREKADMMASALAQVPQKVVPCSKLYSVSPDCFSFAGDFLCIKHKYP